MPRASKTSNVKPTWAVAIEVRRTGLQLSQEIAAERADMSQSYYSEVERGDKPLLSLTLAKLLGLARALDWSLADMQAATGVDLGVPVAEPIGGTAVPVYGLQSLAEAEPKPRGMNLTPHPGRHPEHWRQTVMEGDEMADRIRDGESLYFNVDATPLKERFIYIIEYKGRVYVRRYTQLPSGPAWTAHNPIYAHMFIPHSDEVHVLGHVYRAVGIREDHALTN